jgi:hypothetical protein
MAHHKQFIGICAVSLVAFLSAAGCSSSSKAKKEDETSSLGGTAHGSFRPGSRKIGDDDDSDSKDSMSLMQEQGVLESEDVESVLERNFRKFTRCYERAGEAQRYVEGNVLLRFLISAEGAVTDVQFVENDLGNFAIERCLVVEARAIKFPVPRGRKPTEFEYPLQFKSTREMSLADWPLTSVPPDVMSSMLAMKPCEEISVKPVEAILYIEPSGVVGSVGFLSGAEIQPEAAMCVLEQVKQWRLRGEPGHVLRARVDLHVPKVGEIVEAPKTAAPQRGRAAKGGRRR